MNNVNYHVRQSFVIINNVSPWIHGPELAAARNIAAVSAHCADLVVDDVGEAGVVSPHPHPHLQLCLRGREALGPLPVEVANL